MAHPSQALFPRFHLHLCIIFGSFSLLTASIRNKTNVAFLLAWHQLFEEEKRGLERERTSLRSSRGGLVAKKKKKHLSTP
jgi:hypothetical protein